MIEDIASVTLKHLQVRPHLPVDLSPGDSVGFSNEGDEFLQVPRSVDDVLGSDLSVIIYVALGFAAVKYLSLAHSEQLITVGTLVQVVPLLLEEQLQLLHEKSTDQLVFSLLEHVQSIQADFSCHFTDDLRVDAAHVHLHLGYLLNVLHKEVEALLDEPVDLQEVSRDEDCHCVLDVELGSVVLLDCRLFGVVAIVALLDGKLPAAVATSTTDAVQNLVALLLLLVLLHGEDVVEKPLKDDGVTVD